MKTYTFAPFFHTKNKYCFYYDFGNKNITLINLKTRL